MKKLKAIIFDFDGVICESVDIKTESFKQLYSEYGDQIVKKVVKHHLSNGGVSRFEKIKYYHKNFLDKIVDKNQLKELSNIFSPLVVSKVIEAPYVRGANNFIQDNYKTYDFFISTGTPEDEIIKILEKKDIYKYFKSVYGSPMEKTDHINSIMRLNNYKKNEVVFVGDADTDIIAAENNGITIILRKHNSSICKKEYFKTIKIEDLTDLSSVLYNLNY